MFGAGYGLFLIYFAVMVIVTPSVCVLNWLSMAQARDRRLTAYLHWLRPSAIGASILLASVFVFASASLLHVRAGGVYYLVYILSAASGPFSLCGAYRLWKMLRALPPYLGELPPAGGQEAEGVWPPPPTR